MTTLADQTTALPVRKTITVQASQQHAFEVFTSGIDEWWPRSHHIGKSPLKRTVIQGSVGGRCYGEQEDGTDCPWGTVLTWEPPRRFVMAWQITADWQYEPDLAKSTEVEVRFTGQPDGSTRVDLEHRFFERMGPAGATMRAGVDATMGWGDLLVMFATRAEKDG